MEEGGIYCKGLPVIAPSRKHYPAPLKMSCVVTGKHFVWISSLKSPSRATQDSGVGSCCFNNIHMEYSAARML